MRYEVVNVEQQRAESRDTRFKQKFPFCQCVRSLTCVQAHTYTHTTKQKPTVSVVIIFY